MSWHQIIEALADAIDSGRDQEPCPFSMRDADICQAAAELIRSAVLRTGQSSAKQLDYRDS